MNCSEEDQLFKILLLSPCLIPGKTKHTDSRTSIEITPKDDETILFFHVDDQSNPGCRFRQLLWEGKQGERLCDLIIFYAKESEHTLFFVELKDNRKDLGHATDQVINTYKAFKVRLTGNYQAKAFICAPKGSAPSEEKEYQNRLVKAFQNNYLIGESKDFSDFVRGIVPTSNQGKRKNNKKK